MTEDDTHITSLFVNPCFAEHVCQLALICVLQQTASEAAPPLFTTTHDLFVLTLCTERNIHGTRRTEIALHDAIPVSPHLFQQGFCE